MDANQNEQYHSRNQVLDLDSGTEESGMFGVNIHRASTHHESVQVDKWSAGCQVLADPLDFNLLMALCEKSREQFSNSFTYTLLDEADISPAKQKTKTKAAD